MSAETGERRGHDVREEVRPVQWCPGLPETGDGHLGAIAPAHEFDAGRSAVHVAARHEAFQKLWPPPGP